MACKKLRLPWMLVSRYTTLLLIVGLQPSCARIQAQARVDPQSIAYYDPGKFTSSGALSRDVNTAGACPSTLPGDFNSGAINLQCFYFPDDASKPAYTLAAEAAKTPGQEGLAKILRNNLANILIGRANTVCMQEMGRLTGNESTTNTTLSLLDTLLSTTATIVTGEQAKSIFSGAAGSANAARATVNAEVYRNRLSDAIEGAINNERYKQKTIIDDKLSSKDVGQYGLDQMIRDIDEYHQICSFYNGLVLVNKAVGATKPPENSPVGGAQTASDAIDRQIAVLADQRAKYPSQATGIDAAIKTLREKQTALWTDFVQKTTTDGGGK